MIGGSPNRPKPRGGIINQVDFSRQIILSGKIGGSVSCWTILLGSCLPGVLGHTVGNPLRAIQFRSEHHRPSKLSGFQLVWADLGRFRVLTLWAQKSKSLTLGHGRKLKNLRSKLKKLGVGLVMNPKSTGAQVPECHEGPCPRNRGVTVAATSVGSRQRCPLFMFGMLDRILPLTFATQLTGECVKLLQTIQTSCRVGFFSEEF